MKVALPERLQVLMQATNEAPAPRYVKGKLMEILVALNPLFNGVIAPVLGVFVVPRFLRMPGTGEYMGFRSPILLYLFLGWFALCLLRLLPEFGVTLEAVYRVSLMVLSPFVLGYILVRLTDWAGW